jgi:3-oxoacyl-[acyl-carrier protein] reductase
LGTNLGDRRGNLNRAILLLREIPDTRVVSVADAVETKPVDCPDGSQDFLNSAALLSTELSVRELFKQLQQIEQRLGRQRSARNAPRTIDLDVLLFGDTVLNDPDLVLPHPRMLDRTFVLQPAVQVAGEMAHPVAHVTLRQALAALNQVG